MFLQIDKEYALETDAHNWIISVKTTEPKAGTFWKGIAFYTTLENAVNGLIERKIKLSNADTLQDALSDIKDIVGDVTKALSPKYEIKERNNDKSN